MKTFKRILIRIVLITITVGSLASMVLVIATNDLGKPEVLNVIAASMAVLTAIIASFASIRVVEDSEDSKKSKLVAVPDFYTIPMLVQIQITNCGLSEAKNVTIHLKEKDRITKTQIANLQNKSISMIMPGQVVRLPVDTFDNTISETERITILLTYSDFSGKHKEEYLIDFNERKETTVLRDLEQQMQEKLKEIPKNLKEIGDSLKVIASRLPSDRE